MGFSAPCLFFASIVLLLHLQLSGAINAPIKSLQSLSFDDGYTQIFGDSNLMLLRDGKTVHISLDEKTGIDPLINDLNLK
jgi:xyloglucan:xyloglucosyl transferase